MSDTTSGVEGTPDEPAEPIRAAGVVLWRGDPAAPEIALVRRPRYDDWSLPKGKLKNNEFAPVAALREAREETGCAAVLGRRLGQVGYEVTHPAAKHRGPKVVDYWSARATDDGAAFVPGDEVDAVRWLPVGEARAALSHDVDKGVLDEFAAVPAATAVVLLVRHAKAGSRTDWDTDADNLRPLTPNGREQATHLAEFLALFGVERLISAPRVRCVETIAPLAARLGAQVEEEPLFSEEGYWPSPEAGLARLLDVAGSGQVTVVASQGGVIPSLVETLAGGAAEQDGSVPSKKASTWVLCAHDGALVSADYYAPPRVKPASDPATADPATADPATADPATADPATTGTGDASTAADPAAAGSTGAAAPKGD